MAARATSEAYRALEAAIVTLELPPGTPTTESDLIALTGLGRTPVREAVQRLAWEGLIEVRPRAGLMVAALHAGDWLRVLDARRGLEEVMARGAARLLSPAQDVAFSQVEHRMRGAASQQDAMAFLSADKEMDEILAVSCGNPFAARVAAPLQSHSRRFWFRFNQNTLQESANHHIAVIASIKARDEEKAGLAASQLIEMLRHKAATEARY